ncbi:MAG: hypothetical protein ACJ77N_01385, partial [Chloroflexota bacterium]
LPSGTYTAQAQQSDTATNTGFSAPTTFTVDATAPTVTNVSSTSLDGAYSTGSVIPVTVTFSEPVNVVGTPTLTLAVGTSRAVNYTSGSGTSTLTFNYTVQAGDISADLNYAATTSLTAGTTIRDAAGNDANRTLPGLAAAGSLATNKNIVIDTTAPGLPTVSSTTPASPANNNAPAVKGSAESGSTVTIYTASGCGVASLTASGTQAAFAGTGITANVSDDTTTTFFAKATDAAGNTSACSATSVSYIEDSTPPAVTLTKVNNAAVTFPLTTNTNVTSIGGACGTATRDVLTVSWSATDGITPQNGSVSCTSGTWTATLTTALSAAGNYTVSATQSDGPNTGTTGNKSITIDKTAPTVVSINRADASPTNAGTVDWTVTFSKAVTGVDSTDFALAGTATTGATFSSPTGSGATYNVAASTGAGDGTLGLNLADNDSISDAAGNKLSGTGTGTPGSGGVGNGSFTGATYAIDKTAPTTGATATVTGGASYSSDSWTNKDVSLTLSPSDTGGSGLAGTFYKIDGGTASSYTGA